MAVFTLTPPPPPAGRKPRSNKGLPRQGSRKIPQQTTPVTSSPPALVSTVPASSPQITPSQAPPAPRAPERKPSDQADPVNAVAACDAVLDFLARAPQCAPAQTAPAETPLPETRCEIPEPPLLPTLPTLSGPLVTTEISLTAPASTPLQNPSDSAPKKNPNTHPDCPHNSRGPVPNTPHNKQTAPEPESGPVQQAGGFPKPRRRPSLLSSQVDWQSGTVPLAGTHLGHRVLPPEPTKFPW